ncbi:MAG: hypothetical protein KAR21_08430 [Spirochaetales bacterium]|nr:hypothetical protein [Spirochaetales bacterium]
MKKGITKQIIITVIAVTIGSIFGNLGVEYFLNQNNSFDKQMMKAASELNESCPIMVDTDTRLDNSIALPDNVFQYNYTLVNYTKEELDIEKLEENISPNILNNLKTNPSLKIYRDNKVTMAYSYKDKEGIFLFSLEFKHDDYKE